MSYSSVANYMYSTMVDASNSLTNGTYGNVSLLTFGNTELGRLSVKNSMGVGCNHPSSYLLDVSGSCWVRGDLDISGNVNLSPTTQIFSSWLDTSLNARALDSVVVKTSGDQSISGVKSFTDTINTTGNVVITNDTTRVFKITNSTGSSNCSMTQGSISATGYFWGQNEGGNSYRGTKTGNTNFYLTNDELSYLAGVTSDIQTQLNAKAPTGNYVTTDTTQTITGGKTFNATITLANNSSLVGMAALRMSGSSIQTSGGFYYAATDLRRKLTLAPGGIATNDFQQFSIGTVGAAGGSGSIIYNTPSNSTSHKFTYGASATATADIMTLAASTVNMYGNVTLNNTSSVVDFVFAQSGGAANGGIYCYNNGIVSLNQGTITTPTPRYLIDPFNNDISYNNFDILQYGGAFNLYNTSAVRYGGWNTTKLDLSGTNLQLENTYIGKSGDNMSNATTITKPYNSVYPVEAAGTAYTITLPTIVAADLGKSIIFRKVKQAGTLITISFIGNGTQKVYDSALTGGATAQGLMTSTVYKVELIPLIDVTTGGVYAWFQI